jgi:hypothetical protein
VEPRNPENHRIEKPMTETVKPAKPAKRAKSEIPLWVNVMQAILILIMAVQVFEYFFDHDGLVRAGIEVEGDGNKNLIYEMGARLGVIVVASLFVMVTQNPLQYLVVLVMNVFREGQEMIIDPLWPVADAPASPTVDFLIHVVIVAIEILALLTVYRIVKRANADDSPAGSLVGESGAGA